MPRLWGDTIESHRRDVRDAILHATAELVTERGLLAVTMSEIAERTGIGRATLYKYFSDVETILLAWHQSEITRHLALLISARDQAGTTDRRLEAVFETYALISFEARGHHDTELAAFLHRDKQVMRAERQLREIVRDLLAAGIAAGDIRNDVPAEELAAYCLHALVAAGDLPSKAAVRRLVTVTVAGLRPTL